MDYLLTGYFIGIIIGVPMGTVAALAIQNMNKKGIKGGLATGFGFSMSYLVFIILDVTIVAILAKYIIKAKHVLTIISGAVFIVFGLIRILKKENELDTDNSSNSSFMNFMTAFMVGFTNEIVLLELIFGMIYMGVGKMNFEEARTLVCGCILGVISWWVIFALIGGLVTKIKKIKSMKFYNIALGVLRVALGIVIIYFEIKMPGREFRI